MSFTDREVQSLDSRHKSDSFQVLSDDTVFLSDSRRFALRERVALAFWGLLAIAGIACLAKLFVQ